LWYNPEEGESMNTNEWAKNLRDRLNPIETDRQTTAKMCRLPSNKAVKTWIRDAKRILFPRHFGTVRPFATNKDSIDWRALVRLKRHARALFVSALRYENGDRRCADITAKAETLATAYCEELPEVQALALLDLNAHFDGDPAAENKDLIVLSYPGFYALLIHRLAHPLVRLGVPILPRMMAEFAHRETGIDIHPGAQIGASLMIDHGTGVVIGETARIGERVKIYQGVTLGALSTADGRQLAGKIRHPKIEDRVTIYAGASILGGDTVIGHDSVVGSNAFITSSIPPFSKALTPQGELVVKRKETNR
jgi:serine O-acetyltransferase